MDYNITMNETDQKIARMLQDLAWEVIQAEKRIQGRVRQTYLQRSAFLSEQTGAEVYLKLECLQYTGSFKLRGAMNKLLSLTPEERRAGAVTASTGNHGMAVTHCLQELDMTGTIFVPQTVSEDKKQAMAKMGPEVIVSGTDNCQAQAAARAYAQEHGMIFVAPYNDFQVVAGQGTIGVEVSRQLDRADAIFVCLGGGGLISGVAGVMKTIWPDVEMVGCSPANSAGMIESINAGKIVEIKIKRTLSDGSAGGSIVPGSITFDFCRHLVDRFEKVSEDEIRENLKLFIDKHHLLIEGSAAVPVTTLLRSGKVYQGKTVVIVICGSNINPKTLKSVL